MTEPLEKKICGIIMPISTIDGCSESHWSDVQDILIESIEAAGFEGNIVSNADDVGVIHKRIIQNLYDNPVVVCDVSGKNPNVMFELGIRLAFDKPTIIVKDDKTAYSFDTSAIEHLEYPRDLRFARIKEFKQKLTDKIKATHEKFLADPSSTTFLKHFGEFKVAKLEKKEVPGQEYILEELKSIRSFIRRLEQSQPLRESGTVRWNRFSKDYDLNICLGGKSDSEASFMLIAALDNISVKEAVLETRGDNHKHLLANLNEGADVSELEKLFGKKSRVRKISRKAEAENG